MFGAVGEPISKQAAVPKPSSGGYDARTQYFAKGYPGLRELAVFTTTR